MANQKFYTNFSDRFKQSSEPIGAKMDKYP